MDINENTDVFAIRLSYCMSMNFSHNEMKVCTQIQKLRHVKHVMKQYSSNNR